MIMKIRTLKKSNLPPMSRFDRSMSSERVSQLVEQPERKRERGSRQAHARVHWIGFLRSLTHKPPDDAHNSRVESS